MKRRFSFRIVPLVVFCFLLTSLNAYAFPTIKQEKDQWCWAASSKIILEYYGKTSMTQCEFVKTARSDTVCLNLPETDSTAQYGMHEYGVSSWSYSGSLSVSQITSELPDPIYVNWGWRSGGGHAVVLYRVVASDLYPYDNYYSYSDPWDGVTHTMLEKNFVGGSGYDRTWRSGLKSFYVYK